MKFAMDRFQPLLINMRVNLGRRDIGVAEHLLDDAQIGAIAEQMRGKTVPQKMRINIRFQARNSARVFSRSARSAPSSFWFRARKGKFRCPCGGLTSFGRSL